MKKKLLFVYDYMMVGGTTTALLSLLGSLDKDKYDIDLLLYKKGGPLYDKIPSNVNVLKEAQEKSFLPEIIRKLFISFFTGRIFCSLYYYLKNRKNPSKTLKMAIWQGSETAHVTISRKSEKEYDAVVGFIESWGAHYAVSNKVKAKKRIIWIHPDIDKSYMIAEIDKKMYKKADSIVTVSKECRDNLARHLKEFDKKIIHLENIIPKDEIIIKSKEEINFKPQKEKINMITVCRITYYDKGLDRVLEAMKKLKEEDKLKNICWYLCGDGPDRKNMEEFVKENSLEDYVKFLGKQINPFPYLLKMDLFILPSRYEGKPMAVSEASVLGVPSAVTSYAAATEQIENGIDGIIMENSQQGIYEFLEKLVLGKIDLMNLKKNLLHKDLSSKDIIKKTEELF